MAYRCTHPRSLYLCHGVLHDLLVLHITLVADKELVDTLGGVPVNLLEPLLDVVEGVHIGHIVNNADSVGAAVVGRGNGTEAFLASSVPLFARVSRLPSAPDLEGSSYNLKFDGLAIEFDRADFLRLMHQHHHSAAAPLSDCPHTKSTPIVEM